MKYANLHLHSVYSDSQMTTRQLVCIGKSLGYGALALTDHWTDAGYDEIFNIAKPEGVDVIPGVEFDSKEFGVSFHITALDFDRNNPKIRKLIDDQVEARTESTRKCFERGIELGVVQGVTWDMIMAFVDKGSWVCFDHILRALRFYKAIPQVGGTEELRTKLFKTPEARSFSPQKPSVAEIISTIRQADGIAILAHPHNQTQYVKDLVDMGLNGIEISHPDLIGSSPRLAAEAAEAFGLYRSGGTDHTGAMSGCDGVYATPAYHGVTYEEYLNIKERVLG